jgi:hypothetical protein
MPGTEAGTMSRTSHGRRYDCPAVVAWLAAGFVVSQLAMAVTLERWRPDLRDPEYGHKLRLLRRQTAAGPDRPLLVALGSSRTLNGLRPGVLADGPRLFNFGLTRHGVVQQWLAFDRLLRDGVRPRWVTVELFPVALPQGACELGMTPAGRHTLGDVRFLTANGLRPAAYVGDWLETRAVSIYDSRFAVRSWLCPAWVPWAERHDYVWTHTDASGWLEVPPPIDAAAVRAHAAAVDGAAMRQFSVHPDGDRAMRQTLARCAAEGIGVAVVLMPEASWFRDLYRGEADDRLRAYAATLERECGVPVIDARGWCPDDEFRDGSHLLAAGAARFTERYGREVIPLLTAR